MGQDGGPAVTVAGRVMFARRIGKLTFLKLRDESEDLQVAIDKKRISDLDWQVHDLVDLGDQIVVHGKLGQTKTGEPTVWATSLTFAAKALMPPPGKWHGLEDVELRYRQRYVDLWANPEVMRLAKLRTRVIGEMRSYLTGLGYTEVETPMMQIQPGGAAARPFVTHHNALDIPLYMRIAPELFLKRLLVGGFSKVFEINRNFRNEGISPRHNPEFTMLEAYEAYGSWETMADMVEGLVTHVAERVFGTLQIEHKNEAGEVTRKINLSRPWRRARMDQLVEERTGWKFDKRPLQEAKPELIEQFRHKGQKAMLDVGATPVPTAPAPRDMPIIGYSPAEQLVEVYEKMIEPTLIDPTFVTHVPSVIIPLAKPNTDDPFFADVYELAINGVEISPGYTELNDPDVQQRQFAYQVGDKEEQQKVDEDFLNALRYGMPPAGGMGLGVDRLLMMLTGAESIRDVILFPLMKPQT
jgi:lysyl-tRNA synthetase class 2